MTPRPTAALIHLKPDEEHAFSSAFAQFEIDPVVLAEDVEQRLQKGKFDACVLTLDERAQSILQTLRDSRSNRFALVYGVAHASVTPAPLCKFGINVLLPVGVDRPAILKAVRATYLLVLHEFRRYVRIPIVTPVEVQGTGRTCSALSRELSVGGMSLTAEVLPPLNQDVTVVFHLPPDTRILLPGLVCWLREAEHAFGVRFVEGGEDRVRVRAWVEDYLEIR